MTYSRRSFLPLSAFYALSPLLSHLLISFSVASAHHYTLFIYVLNKLSQSINHPLLTTFYILPSFSLHGRSIS